MYNRNLVQLWVGLWCVRHDLWYQWLLSDSVTWQQRWTNLLKLDFGLWKANLDAECNLFRENWFWTLRLFLGCWFVQGWTIGKRVTLTNTLERMSWALAFYLILANHQPLKYINILPRINMIMESESFDFKLLLMLLLWQSSNRFVKMAMTPGLWSLLRKAQCNYGI